MFALLQSPLRGFAVRAVASLDAPDTKAGRKKLRTALLTTLSAAGIDVSRMGKQATASAEEFADHTLLVWFDVACDALRIFAPTENAIDDTTAKALELLNGSVILDWSSLPVEDLDAAVRVLARMKGAGVDAEDLHARLVAPNLHMWDEAFTAPDVSELEELWGTWFRYYVGGDGAPPVAIEAWIARAFAFGSGAIPPRAAPAAKKRRARR